MLYDVRVSTTGIVVTGGCSMFFYLQIIIPGLRLRTFDGLHLLFSSVIPLDTRPETTDIWNLAEAFGASCHSELTSEVTHLVAAKVTFLPLQHCLVLTSHRMIARYGEN